ncbi:SDR family NAD(P)-dependent oxidoreductase [Thermomonospora cellulosilytica]|uniref:NAD(P)-dependent dehydrogenase (Short-subunit alcohol dehydrogenase family) n=1 Tax=Thermomonospora cellulosilytica TaxID=1411118 RepID=A0A7W3N578_9ACTN|nr:glucose 1-dehydrogenase [Thermomonospora cellulosilytica]MBA9007763.1 NAD(P)-dependent dehydrogenase (short-subunit alcohol dehydrogenase family) [Thermomonospora cellulosilytica]
MTEFDGKVVLITGGGSGMGLATARRLLDSGARVVLAGRSEERLKTATEDLGAGDRVLAVPADVARTGDLDHLMDRTRERFGRLDGVFANAGVAPFARSADVTEADFDHIVDINFKGVFFTVQKSLPLLADGGSIVLNSSWLTHRGMAFTSVYAAAKAAVRNLAQTLAADLAERGVRVNSVSPGYIVTPMFESIATTEDARQACRSQVALGRLGRPADIADGVLFLLSPRASYITGQELLIDGGLIRSIPL